MFFNAMQKRPNIPVFHCSIIPYSERSELTSVTSNNALCGKNKWGGSSNRPIFGQGG
jgi:hypothetical protein